MGVDINWGALQPAPNAFGLFVQGQEAGTEMRKQKAKENAFQKYSTDPKGAIGDLMGVDPASAIQLRSLNREDEADAGYHKATDQYAAGDTAGAAQTALGTHNAALAQQFAALSKEQRELLHEQSGQVASALYPISKLPVEQRAAAWEATKPTLIGQKIPAAALNIDVTDDNAVQGHISDAMKIQDLLGQADKDRTFGETQNHNRAMEKAAGIKTVAPGGDVVDTNAPASVGTTPTPAGKYGALIDAAVTKAAPGAILTSGQRSAEHNAEVGGVAGSFHLTDNARDYIPPPGTSLQQLRDGIAGALGPDYQVLIDKGNHVHVEPGPRLASSGAAPAGARVLYHAPDKPDKENLSPPTTIEHIVNGEPVQVVAMFDKAKGRYLDMSGNAVDTTGLRVLPSGGSRATLGLLRVSTAAADAATGIENLSKLPAGSNMGWFSQAANTPMGALKRVLSPQEAQDMRTTAAGLSRAMAGLATGGLAVDIETQKSYDALIPQAGQTRLTALRQMGEMRQQAENGIESALSNPYISPQQKANLEKAKAKIASAIPWTPTDVSNLENAKSPNATMHGMGVKALPAKAAVSASDAALLAKYGVK